MGIPMGLHEPLILSLSFRELTGREREEESMLEAYHDAFLEALNARAGKWLTAREIADGLEDELPQHTLVIVLGELAHEGLVERRSKPGRGRQRATQWYRAGWEALSPDLAD